MAKHVLVLASLLLTLSLASQALAADLRSDIKWLSPADVNEDFLESNEKPILYFIHKTWCGACKNLKSAMKLDDATTKEWVELSKNYVMVTAGDDDEPQGPEFSPDGGYIPRLLFSTPDGKVDHSVKAPNGNPQYGYYYSSVSQIVTAMKSFLELDSGAATA